MKKAFTLIEVLIVVAIVAIVGVCIFSTSPGCGNGVSSYGRNLKQDSVDNTEWQTKYHWTDTATSEHFYSYSRDGGTLYPE